MKKICIILIDFYQKRISPMFKKHCKYEPSCSQYMKDAINKYGILKGGLKGIVRIIRCNPFSKGGYDPLK